MPSFCNVWDTPCVSRVEVRGGVEPSHQDAPSEKEREKKNPKCPVISTCHVLLHDEENRMAIEWDGITAWWDLTFRAFLVFEPMPTAAQRCGALSVTCEWTRCSGPLSR